MIASDGDLEEGVSGEASSLAGHQQLGNLTVIYDANQISIEDDTDIAFSEDVAARYEAYGWHVQDVDWTNGGTGYEEDVQALYDAIEAAKAVTDKPSFIRLHTIIGWPAPTKQNTGKIHGSALGADEVAATKKVLGFDPEQTFEVADDVIAHTRKALDRGKAAAGRRGTRSTTPGRAATPERAALLDRLRKRELPDGWKDALPSWDADAKGVATRAASGEVLTKLSPELPELWGGSADLAGSNNTTIEGRAVVHPGRARHQGVPGRRVRPGAALRHPRARHGRDPERHRPARPDPPVRRHVPDLLRLHAPGGPAGRADEAAGHLRVDARLDRPRRGRPDPPAGRAPRRTAGDPRPGRRTAR